VKIQVSPTSQLVFERLGDGSSLLFDPTTDSVHALNPTATKVWEVLREGGDEERVRQVLVASLGQDAGELALQNTLGQFRQAGLIRTDADTMLLANASRRETLRRLSLGFATAMAFPLIQTLTGSEQRAHAQGSGSQQTTIRPTTAGDQ
jgi:PqqD family protein of HPr-rel-A system